MEKKQYDLCVEVLKRLDRAGILKNLILIGSWCLPFYNEYFKGADYNPSLRTRDIDFLIPLTAKFKKKIDLPKLLEDLGFLVGFKGEEGYIRLENPDLAIEFLVPEIGRGSNKPYPLKELGINAQALRYLNLLTQDLISTEVEGVKVVMPHPVIFAFHKLIIAPTRKDKDKEVKDKEEAIKLLKAVFAKGSSGIIKKFFSSLLLNWRKKIIKSIDNLGEFELLRVLVNDPKEI